MNDARWLSPGALDVGDVLCGDDGKPFATVCAVPIVDPATGSVWVPTDMLDVEFPPGATANVQYR